MRSQNTFKHSTMGIMYDQKKQLGIKKIFIHIWSCAQKALLNRNLSVEKDSLSISPTDKTLPEYIQTIDRQRLAW